MTDLVDIDEAAAMTHLSPATIRFYIQKEIECGTAFGHVGRRRLARRSDIQAWLDSKLPAVVAGVVAQ